MHKTNINSVAGKKSGVLCHVEAHLYYKWNAITTTVFLIPFYILSRVSTACQIFFNIFIFPPTAVLLFQFLKKENIHDIDLCKSYIDEFS